MNAGILRVTVCPLTRPPKLRQLRFRTEHMAAQVIFSNVTVLLR